MRKILTVFTLMIAGMFAFTACSDDNSPGNQPDGTPLNPTDVPAAVLSAFEEQYPDANNVQWTKKDNYAVATFTKSGDTSGQQSAWFAWDNGTWGMTEYEIPYSLLPDDVRTAFEASEYAASPWRYDREIDVLQRNETETLYVIEVEKNEAGTETEVDLYYTSDGLLVKEIIDAERDKDYHEFLPQAPEGSISDWLSANFPDARIIDTDYEDGGTEIELISNGLKHEILFNASNAWVLTKTEYEDRTLSQVPVDLSAIEAAYPDAWVEEVTRYETAEGDTYYCVEFENRRDDDFKVYIDAQGAEIDRPVSDTGSTGGIPVESDIEAFLADRYPGAVIIEKDYDDGYLEIDFRHDNYIKEAYFNGTNAWVRTTWELRRASELPAAVSSALDAQYAGYRVDDIEAIETADALHYELELENGRNELKVIFAEDGTLVNERRDD